MDDVVAMLKDGRKVLPTQVANCLDIGKSHWAHLEGDAFMRKCIPGAPGKRTGAPPLVAYPFVEGQ